MDTFSFSEDMKTMRAKDRLKNFLECNWDAYTAFQGLTEEEAFSKIEDILRNDEALPSGEGSWQDWAKRCGC